MEDSDNSGLGATKPNLRDGVDYDQGDNHFVLASGMNIPTIVSLTGKPTSTTPLKARRKQPMQSPGTSQMLPSGTLETMMG